MDDYQVRLEFFEGPMDLLVYLIRKNEIDIYDIPIALIADQYLEYVSRIETLNLEKAGDFLLLAATLLEIKSKMLLPRPEIGEEEFEDPRTELVEKIVEYMQFKEIADRMSTLEDLASRQAERGFSEVDLYRSQEDEDLMTEATVSELILAFSRLLVQASQPEPVHRVLREKISTAARVNQIRKVLAQKRRVLFSDLVEEGTGRLFVVVTLVALLEMAKGGEIQVEQNDTFTEICIARARLKPVEEESDFEETDQDMYE
ncbi:MAG TPA: segregation/condensation protein A [archaeon]|nr:segregation/condensation protein A [archaeon]